MEKLFRLTGGTIAAHDENNKNETMQKSTRNRQNNFYKKCALLVEQKYSDLASSILLKLLNKYNNLKDIPEERLTFFKLWIKKDGKSETTCLSIKTLSELPSDAITRITKYYLRELKLHEEEYTAIIDIIKNAQTKTDKGKKEKKTEEPEQPEKETIKLRFKKMQMSVKKIATAVIKNPKLRDIFGIRMNNIQNEFSAPYILAREIEEKVFDNKRKVLPSIVHRVLKSTSIKSREPVFANWREYETFMSFFLNNKEKYTDRNGPKRLANDLIKNFPNVFKTALLTLKMKIIKMYKRGELGDKTAMNWERPYSQIGIIIRKNFRD